MPASIAAGIAVLGIAAMLVPRFSESDFLRVATRHGEQRSLTLADGSVVQLNTDTQIAYHLDNSERHVKLTSGEAFFDVAKDSSRHFVVSTNVAEIRVVGTQFSVRTRGDGGVEVVVKEGEVKVVRTVGLLALPQPKVPLTPGARLRMAAADKPPVIAAVDPVRATAWRSGILDIDAMRLDDVIAEVNRYVAVPFVIEDDELRSLQLSGRFRLSDTESIRFMLRERLRVESTARADAFALRTAP